MPFSNREHYPASSLQWRQNDRDSVPNHQPQNCLLNRVFMRRSKKPSQPSITGLGIHRWPAQRASSAVNNSIYWRHHVIRNTHQKDIIRGNRYTGLAIFQSHFDSCINELHRSCITIQGLYSLSGKTSYHQISWIWICHDSWQIHSCNVIWYIWGTCTTMNS